MTARSYKQLTDAQVSDIRVEYVKNYTTMPMLAKQYGCSRNQIFKIIHDKVRINANP